MNIHKMSTTEIGNYLRGNRECAFILWQISDVEGIAEDEGIELSRKRCLQILRELDAEKDCERGITWEDLRNKVNE